jgi:hypothetical protein
VFEAIGVAERIREAGLDESRLSTYYLSMTDIGSVLEQAGGDHA